MRYINFKFIGDYDRFLAATGAWLPSLPTISIGVRHLREHNFSFSEHCNRLPAPAGAQFRVDRWLKLFSGACGESITRFLKITIGFRHLRELDFLFNKNWDCLPAPAGAQFWVYWWFNCFPEPMRARFCDIRWLKSLFDDCRSSILSLPMINIGSLRQRELNLTSNDSYYRLPTPASARLRVNDNYDCFPALAGFSFRITQCLQLFSGASGSSISRLPTITVAFWRLR